MAATYTRANAWKNGGGHFAAMAFVTFVMASERLEQPKPLTWRLRFPAKLIRIVFAQTRIRLQILSSGFGSSSPVRLRF
jgi:hypothetical protein